MITLDTSAIFAYLNQRDTHHQLTIEILQRESGPLYIPVSILSEITYLLESRQGNVALDLFLADIESGSYQLDCGADDVGRIRTLISRYQDLPLGFADSSVIACAERRGGRVLSFDHRHFGVVAREQSIVMIASAPN